MEKGWHSHPFFMFNSKQLIYYPLIREEGMTTDIVILAAGQGTRMKSALPKVLHKLGGKPLLQHVVDTARCIADAKIVVVAGHGIERVEEAVCGNDITYVQQAQQLGTAHAVLQAAPHLQDRGKTLVLYGDVPLIRRQTLVSLLEAVEENSLGLLTVDLPDPFGYGRIIRNAQGQAEAIVEQKDASSEQQRITEVNTGVLAVNTEQLRNWLPGIENQNAQREYYLTDLIAIAHRADVSIETRQPVDSEEVQGINDRLQLAELERYFQYQTAVSLMKQGVTLADPRRFDCRGALQAGSDTVIDVNCVFEGKVQLGNNVTIGANTLIKDCQIADNVEIKPNSLIEEATIGDNAVIGPFARIRPGTVLANNTKVGNFVETKKAVVGEGSKINHLSYVGDATLGSNVNVGAGTITCNYDGVNKHHTEIEDDAFIGSNTALVAPVKVGKGATVGAGSAISKNVKDNELALTRSKQTSVPGWQRPEKNNR